MAKIFGIIPAAGSGTRMNAEVPKVLLPLRGEPAVARTMRLLGEKVRFDFVIVAASRHDLPAVANAIKQADIPHAVIEGGASREESVTLALGALEERCAPAADDIILIHDAARCFVSPSLAERCVAEALSFGAVTAAIPVSDTLVKVDGSGRTAGLLDRAGAWAVQTPQVFRFELIKRAHEAGPKGATDDASLVAAFHPVKVVEGNRENLKLTTRDDYEFAITYLV